VPSVTVTSHVAHLPFFHGIITIITTPSIGVGMFPTEFKNYKNIQKRV